jgi:hypothetical protein
MDAKLSAEDGGDGEGAYDWGNEFSGGGDGDDEGSGKQQQERAEAGYANTNRGHYGCEHLTAKRRLAFHVRHCAHVFICFPSDASSSVKFKGIIKRR